MNVIKIYQVNGFKPEFATEKSSGIDILANAMDLILNSNEGQLTFMLLGASNLLAENKKEIIRDNLRSIRSKVKHLKIYNAYIKYYTGLRVILDDIDLKVYPKSSKFIKAPFLGSLENDIGLIDEDYRGEILVIYNLEQSITNEIFDHAVINLYAVREFANNVYMPGDKAIAQLVPPKGKYKIEYIEKWTKEFENTERGTGGHGSTNK